MEHAEERWIENGLWVGAWRVDPQLNRISKQGNSVRLEPKVMQVFVCLIRRPRKTVTKDMFMEQVWGDTVVTDDALSRCISELRKVLGDDARDPEYIETIRKAGYRLLAPVRHAPPPAAAKATGAETAPRSGAEEALSPGVLASDVLASGASVLEAAREKKNRLAAAHSSMSRHLKGRAARARAQGVQRWMIGAALLALLAAVAFGAWAFNQAETAAPSEAVPFTSFPGEEFDSALSPDGKQTAFVWDGGDGENFDIYVKQSSAEEPLRLTDDPARESSPAWSPDGSKLAFVRADGEQTSIVVVPVIGTGERELARFENREVQGLVWSPDGARMALSVQRSPYDTFRIELLRVDSLSRTPLTNPPSYVEGDLAPAFSPDGKTVAFTRSFSDRVQDVYTVPTSGGEPRRLTHDRAAVTGLDWTTDGSSIVFASNRDGISKLWRIPAAGGVPAWIATTGSGELHQPSIARTGGRMTLTERSFNTNIWYLRRVPGYDRLSAQRLISSTRWDSNPDISPDGQRLAFVSRRSGAFEVWTSRSDGTEPARVTEVEGSFASTPRWSPDGQRLAFVSQEDESASLYVVDAAGGTPRRVTTGEASDAAPSWSRSGDSLYFASNRTGKWQVWKTPASGGGLARQVTRHGGFAAREGPDGRFLYYVKHSTPGIWRQPLGGGDETLVTDQLEPYDWGNWDVTTRGLYFVRRAAPRPLLTFYNPDTGRSLRVAYLDDLPRHPGLAVAPDASWFLYSRVDRSESDIMVVERFFGENFR